MCSGGRTIVFTETKDYSSELAGILPGARPLHGDIQQSQREVGLLHRHETMVAAFSSQHDRNFKHSLAS